MYVIPSDVVAFFGPRHSFILYNLFARTCLAVDIVGLNSITSMLKGERPDDLTIKVWEINWFSNEEGLLCDPTRVLRDSAGWPEAISMPPDALLNRLLELCLLVEDEAAYQARFSPKSSLLDFHNFGNFHQQLGQHLLAVKRTDPVSWWYGQKFTDDLKGIKDNLYKSVQEAYLKDYFSKKLGKGICIADVGCGIGYYSEMMAQFGAEVLALDPNEEYIELAASSAPDNIRFLAADIGSPGGMDHVESESLDFIFMSDALLFYFVPERPGQKADISILMKDFQRVLKPGGTFISLEPHASFFLTPWFGAEDRPFTVLTEYRHRRFSIVPSMSDMVKAIVPYGFCISFMDELYSQITPGVEQRAHAFAQEFPVWQLLEFTKNP